MLEYDIYDYLNADVTLGNLLNDSAGNSKIYPIRAPQGTDNPYVVYEVSGYGDDEEYKHKERITYKIVSESYTECRNIRDRMRTLLDLQDLISITSSNYRIVWAKFIGGQDMEDSVNDPDTENPVKIIVVIYEFSYINR